MFLLILVLNLLFIYL